MATFILVHGTGCGGWVWQKLTPLLRAGGHEVYTPTLTGVGDRSHLLDCGVDLFTHITDVTSLIEYEDLTDVVLVGHSYAGMVITAVAAKVPERLSEVVYLDAYLPDEGQSEADLWPKEMRKEIFKDFVAGKGVRQPPSLGFLGITDLEMGDWVKARMTPHPLATYNQPAPVGNSKSAALPHIYIHCTAGPTAPLFATFAKKAKEKDWEVYELATGHMVMLTLPHDLATILLNLADQIVRNDENISPKTV
jgi:pimeloyl-ACP methyl ester carboxylesterase